MQGRRVGERDRRHAVLARLGDRRLPSRAGREADRLQLLEPFEPWDGQDFTDLPILVKAVGKCTTDHISMAGPWLKYRGHLENISGNLFLGAVNAFTDAVGEGKDQLDGTTKSFPDIAKHYHEAGQPWIAVGDENWGEGSSREHAAMEPRFRGAKAILVRSRGIYVNNALRGRIYDLRGDDYLDVHRDTLNDALLGYFVTLT